MSAADCSRFKFFSGHFFGKVFFWMQFVVGFMLSFLSHFTVFHL